MLDRLRKGFIKIADQLIENHPAGRAESEVLAFAGGRISLPEAYRRIAIKEELSMEGPNSLRFRFDDAVSRAAEEHIRPFRG